MNELVLDCDECPRCGLRHADLALQPLARPVGRTPGPAFSYWAPCPENGQPVLFQPAGVAE